jgi:hypothetical protein
VTLSATPEKSGNAVKSSLIPKKILSSPTSSGSADESVLNAEVFYLLQSPTAPSALSSNDVSVIDAALS